MKIASIESRVEALPLSRPYKIAYRDVDAVEIAAVEIALDGGIVGRGAASPGAHVTGETPAACREALSESSLSWLLGADIRRRGGLCDELERRLPSAPAARAAADMALCDAHAQLAGLPLADLLGRAHDALPTSITIGILPVEATLAEAQEYLGRGFRILKVKLGRDLDEDVERLQRLRETIPGGVRVRVDPNQGYRPEDLRAFLDRTRRLDLELIEQPLAAGDLDTPRALPPEDRRRLAADESLVSPRDGLSLVQPPPACGIFNIKLMKCGGIRPALRLAAIAEAAGLELMWGCNDESRVSIAAALHAAFASPATRYLDLDGSLDLARDLATGGFELEDGMMRTTAAPGLGLTPRP